MLNINSLTGIDASLLSSISEYSKCVEFPDGTEILRDGQYVKHIPLVVSGLIKVFTRNHERELLLYYIKSGESCVMSYAAGLNNEPSKVFAFTEGKTEVILMPVEKVKLWSKQIPDFNALFLRQYNLRYTDMLDTINQVLFEKLDKRLLDYLIEKARLTSQNPIKITHGQIAGELGTAREVISRLVKKLEIEGKVKQHTNAIEIYTLVT